MQIRIFRKFDDNKNPYMYKGVKETDFEHAMMYNKKGFGIFFTPNPCIGRLIKQNIIAVQWWFVDIDEGEKPDILQKITSSPLSASVIVETKRGYHAYWRAKNGTVENFEKIENALIDYFGGDKGVKNVNRLMRVPGFYHVKDVDNPFLIKVIEQNEKEYTEELMQLAFVPIKKVKIRLKKQDEEVKIDKFRSEDTLIKYFCSKLNGDLSCFNADSGRRNYLLKMIGRLKRHYKYSYEERAYIINTINKHFACPLDSDEVETVLKTTIKDSS